MEPQFNPYQNPRKEGFPKQMPIRPNYFELFAFGLAVASLFSCSFIYTAYLFGGLAILFALLSRGANTKLSPKAKQSIVFGIAGILVATILFVTSFLFMLEQYGSIEGMLRATSEQMGIDFEAEFGPLFQ